ncbi:MAG: hypothetical protein QOE82_2685 [Thermoanaerobaculia bacterium]|nr:hypothetical protein [Thermoanaerobaculia bacterium]
MRVLNARGPSARYRRYGDLFSPRIIVISLGDRDLVHLLFGQLFLL